MTEHADRSSEVRLIVSLIVTMDLQYEVIEILLKRALEQQNKK